MFCSLALCNNVTPVAEAEDKVPKEKIEINEVAARESLP